MNINSYEFTYSPENLKVNFDIISGNFDEKILIIMVISLIIGFLFYFFIPNLLIYFDANKEYLKKLEDKNVIHELILMKEVQNELDNEINESLLNAGLKSASI